MGKHQHRPGQLLVVTMLPMLQEHEMMRDVQEDLRPKRKKKHGGKVPGLRAGGRADRKPRQVGGGVQVSERGEPIYQPIRKTPDVDEEKRDGRARG
jgi:hypothetical protein